MNKLLILFLFLLVALSCRTSLPSNAPVYKYPDDWLFLVNKAIDFEVNKESKCPTLLKSRVDDFKWSAAQTQCELLVPMADSLMSLHEFEKHQRPLYIINSYVQGFNYLQCTRFIVNNAHGKAVSNFKICKGDPAPDSIRVRRFVLQKQSYHEVEPGSKYFLGMKSNCILDGFYVITRLNRDFSIRSVRVALMPNP